jgi:16S rRNA (adenine1518-N6/adenine1519-N6)-dimethyltransferase
VTLTRRELLTLLAEHGVRPSRAMGQNFVVDANTLRRIVRLAGLDKGQPVLEIGAGLGALSAELAHAGARVTAVEADSRLVPLLRDQVEQFGVHVVQADALDLDFEQLLRAQARDAPEDLRWTLVANLPYNVAVPVVARALDEGPSIASMLVMVQREVGERLAADPGSSAYGAVSVKVAYHARAEIAGRVPASVFVPRPRVESVLVRIVRRPRVAVDPTVVPPERLFHVVRAGFAHRRKMLRGALAGVVEPEAFLAAGIDPRARAEELSVEEWGRLAA